MREARIGFGPTPLKEIGLRDQNINIRVFEEPPVNNGTYAIRIEQEYPIRMKGFDARIALTKELEPDKRDESDERQLIGTAGPSGEISNFSDIKNYHDLVAGIGYRYSEDTRDEGSTIERTIRFEYPTVQRLNEFSKEAFPNGDTVQFAEYAGGHYSAMEFMSSLVNDGKVLIASQQPYQIHEHAALHVLGWIGLGGEYLKHIRPVYRSFLDRMEAEATLPPVYGIENKRVSSFLRPSLEVLKSGMASLDTLSFEVGEAIFISGNNSDWGINEEIKRRLESSFNLRQSTNSMPYNILAHPSPLELTRFSDDVLRRYAKAEEYAQGQIAA